MLVTTIKNRLYDRGLCVLFVFVCASLPLVIGDHQELKSSKVYRVFDIKLIYTFYSLSEPKFDTEICRKVPIANNAYILVRESR